MIWKKRSNLLLEKSPSLRGSGLKYAVQCQSGNCKTVSLFTREWIEIQLNKSNHYLYLSPSLRGSGLKCGYDRKNNQNSGLPLYEGVD